MGGVTQASFCCAGRLFLSALSCANKIDCGLSARVQRWTAGHSLNVNMQLYRA